MSVFVVHTIPGGPFARAVFATLEEKSAPYRIAPVAPGSHKSPEHLARHPFGRVPVLEHDGSFCTRPRRSCVISTVCCPIPG
jgi:glutathione S-transferase